MSDRRLIVYELNEVPLRIVHHYVARYPSSNFGKLLSFSHVYTTHCSDQGELHPWTTWPTLHRGVPQKLHKIYSLNQDLSNSSNYPPIWEVLSSAGIKIGIYGSLHSYPYPGSSENISFYMPDTFAPEPTASSPSLTRLQKFNLRLSSSNKAVTGNIGISDAINFVFLVLRNDISLSSAFSTILHLCWELLDPAIKARRSFVQSNILFNSYISHLRRAKPAFSTFFTNHVAGVMHRFWLDTFPEDYPEIKHRADARRASHIFAAMDLADKQVGELYDFCSKNNADLWILSSMGQSAVEHINDDAELVISNFEKFLSVVNQDEIPVLRQPSMHPDLCMEFSSAKDKNKFLDSLASLRDLDGVQIMPILYDVTEKTVNASLKCTRSIVTHSQVVFGKRSYLLSDMGLSLLFRRRATAYHDPCGIFIAWGSKNPDALGGISSECVIDTQNISSMMKQFFDI